MTMRFPRLFRIGTVAAVAVAANAVAAGAVAFRTLPPPALASGDSGIPFTGARFARSPEWDVHNVFSDGLGVCWRVGYADENGGYAALYDYDAFGNEIASSGPLAAFFRHRFSTKLLDPDTGLYYYGYRWYSPELGRWISRDPIEEEGGVNLYGFCRNGTYFGIDPIGMKRYITQFDILGITGTRSNPIRTHLHVGVAVDLWEKRKDNPRSRCWHWKRTGILTFDFRPDIHSVLGLPAFLATIGKGSIKVSEGMTLVDPIRYMSTPEEDKIMLSVISAQIARPPPYNFFVMNCAHWAFRAIKYGLGTPNDPGPYDYPRIRSKID